MPIEPLLMVATFHVSVRGFKKFSRYSWQIAQFRQTSFHVKMKVNMKIPGTWNMIIPGTFLNFDPKTPIPVVTWW